MVSLTENTGLIVSLTVTSAVWILLLPLTSLTVTLITVFPVSPQAKDDWLNRVSSISQLSEADEITSEFLIFALPAASRYIVVSRVVNAGRVVSSTKTS